MPHKPIQPLPPLQELVQNLAATNRISLVSRKPIQTLLHTRNPSRTSSYRFGGQFEDLVVFVEKLEGAAPPWEIKEMRISGHPIASSDDRSIRMDILIELPFSDQGYP